MVSESESKVLIRAGEIWAHFSERISKLPKHLQKAFFADLEVAIDNRLKVLERQKK